ncbi:hypothetical protein TD95_003379, partial [Thielaviopsis punctulata]
FSTRSNVNDSNSLSTGHTDITSRRVVHSNENNSSATVTAIARAKATALTSEPSKGLQTKRVVNSTVSAVRRRAALGDVSNVGKAEAADGTKKSVGLVSKAIQPSATRTTRAPIITRAKEVKKQPIDLKRTTAPSGIQKRKAVTSSAYATTTEAHNDEQPARKRVTVESDRGIRAVAAPSRATTSTHPTISTSRIATAAPRAATTSSRTATTSSRTATTSSRAATTTSRVPAAPRAALMPAAPAPVPVAPVRRQAPVDEFVYPPGVKNLDAEDYDDPLMVAEYSNDIFEYLREIEPDTLPHPDYMEVQDDLEWKTRAILVDWLVEVHTRFHLLPETLYLAINIADRFMSLKTVHLQRLQLVGMTAMLIAAKYEEIVSPSISSFHELAEGGFTEEEILSAERAILSTLDYNMSYPNPVNFLRRISKADNYNIEARTIGKYLMEISILDHRLIGYPGSLLASGAMYLSRLILDRGEWNPTLVFYSGYSEDEIEPIVAILVDYMVRPTTHQAFFRKYACKKFLKASIIARSWAKANMRHFRISNPHIPVDDLV